jgi:hypothetical protein
MKKILLWLIFFSALSPLQAQIYFYKNYDWLKTPETYTLKAEELALDEVMVKDKRSVELVVQNDELSEYHLTHRIIRLNTNKAIEKNNKYYVYNYGASKVLVQKARVIKPDGTIVELSKEDIQESKNEEGLVEYQYFAFEGIELGSYIEYFDLMIFPPTLSGSTLSIQSSVLKKNVEFDLISPSHIEYQIHCINGLPEFVHDTTALYTRRMVLKLAELKPLTDESWSAYAANIQKCYYKFNRNRTSGKANFYNYSEVSQQMHERFFAPLTKKELTLVKKFMKDAGTDAAPTKEDKVRSLEKSMKKIAIYDENFQNSEDLTFILSKQAASEEGISKLMINCLRELGMSFELVLTCDRFDNKFLSNFEGYNFLQEYLIYVKDIDKYFSASQFHRLGFPPEELAYNNGLFISEVKIGELVTGIGKVKYIQGTAPALSVDRIDTKVSFNDDFSSTEVQLERNCTGYKAFPYQAFLNVMDQEKRKEMQEEYLKYLDPETPLEQMTFTNDNPDELGAKPYIGKATIHSPNFVEKGGENYLFKAGMLIGPQSELYNQAKRETPVETEYKRMYERKMEIVIPAGYFVVNPEDLKIVVTPDGPKDRTGFTSVYTLKDNVLTVEVKEWYNDCFFPVADYPKYESVINAAADFNKIVLVIQKR